MNKENEWIPSEIYAEYMNRLPICCVDILLFNPAKTKVLLCKRKNEPLKGIYFSTGGRLQKGEELKDCATRKAKEELGVEIRKEQLLAGGIISEIYPNSSFGDTIGYHAITVYFGYSIPENTVIDLDNQHEDSMWFDINDQSINSCVKERINTIIQNL